jgi:hypothetical protein
VRRHRYAHGEAPIHGGAITGINKIDATVVQTLNLEVPNEARDLVSSVMTSYPRIVRRRGPVPTSCGVAVVSQVRRAIDGATEHHSARWCITHVTRVMPKPQGHPQGPKHRCRRDGREAVMAVVGSEAGKCGADTVSGEDAG